MPIYEYNCKKCGVFETVQKITEKPLKKCPTCKSAVERIVSRTSFVLKGSGWYATDYGRGKSGSSESVDSSASSSNGGTTGKSSASEKSAPGEKSASSEKPSSGKSAPSSPSPATKTSD